MTARRMGGGGKPFARGVAYAVARNGTAGKSGSFLALSLAGSPHLDIFLGCGVRA